MGRLIRNTRACLAMKGRVLENPPRACRLSKESLVLNLLRECQCSEGTGTREKENYCVVIWKR